MDTQSVDGELGFDGPFKFLSEDENADLFRSPRCPQGPGLYLWVIENNKRNFVHYVGQTPTSLQARLSRHLGNYLGGYYFIYEPRDLQQLRLTPAFRGSGPAAFLRQQADLWPKLTRMLDMLKIFAAAASCDRRTLLRIEAALGLAALTHESTAGLALCDFRKRDLRPRTPDEPERSMCLTLPEPVAGMPETIAF